MTVIPHWLTKQASLKPNKLAIEEPTGEMLTFSTLEKLSKQRAKQLSKLGIKQGMHIGLYSGNDREMIITIHALSYLGAVIVLLNRRLTRTELEFQLKDAEVKTVIVSDSLASDFARKCPSITMYTFSEIKEIKEKNISLREELSLDEPFTMMYTSGTTGQPKAVVHTYGNHYFSAISSSLNLGLYETDKWLCMLPIFHVSGFSICMRSVIYGMPLYLLENFSEEAAHEAIMNRGVTIASVVTVMLERLLKTIRNKIFPKTFRCMLLGGGPCPVDTLKQAKEKNIPVFQSYGMTETSSQIVTLSPGDALKKLGSSGKPLSAAQLKIVQPDKSGVGEIYLKGPMVTKGYYNNDRANEAAFVDGWLKTGDLGYIDESGYLYVVDRRKDLIISGGENIYPTEIEHTLKKLPSIKDIGVVGKKDETWGEVPVAFVVTDDSSLTENDLKQFASKHLASFKIPKSFIFVDHLPRNVSNKLMRHRLKSMVKEDL